MAIDETFRWCINPACKYGQAHSEGDIFRCVECGHKACVNCNVDWHTDETCTTFQARVQSYSKQEEDSAKAVEKIAKLCPGCNRKLEKTR